MALFELDAIPTQSCVLLDSREEALAYPRAPFRLVFCDACGFAFNSLFDPALLDYAAATEESQHFSGTFNRFAFELVAELADRAPLDGRTVVEIGCGKGDFLIALCEATGAIGIGIDPGFIVERAPEAGGARVTFRREAFDPARIDVTPDLVACRHTLEHIADVAAFTADIEKLAGNRPEAGILIEVPDVGRILREGAFWDIYYEHCSYFTPGSLARLFRRHGLPLTGLSLAFADQYIVLHAAPAGSAPALPLEDDLDDLRQRAATFPAIVENRRRSWADFVADRSEAGKRTVLWGGGSKAVSFLTTNAIGGEVAFAVDINPFKQGKYLPGTGHKVEAPEALPDSPPDTVIVMNPIYVAEIEASLAAMDLFPEIVAL